MKALSIRQPWAWAILHAGKDIENRDWSTRFRGEIAVHASKGMTQSEFDDFVQFAAYEIKAIEKYELVSREDLVFGAILGTVQIVDCVSKSDSPWFVGDYGFVLRKPLILPEPIPIKGALSFWDVPVDIERRIMEQTL